MWIPGNYGTGYNTGGNGLALYMPGTGLYIVSGIGGQVAGGCF
jgi:hypothetical protein